MITKLVIEADGVEFRLHREGTDIFITIDRGEPIAMSTATAQTLGGALLDMGNGEDDE